jgi:hypothetical protein
MYYMSKRLIDMYAMMLVKLSRAPTVLVITKKRCLHKLAQSVSVPIVSKLTILQANYIARCHLK